MATLYCWDIDCAIDGVFTHWSEDKPFECPNDSGHTVNDVVFTVGNFNGGVPTAPGESFMNDGAGRVYKIDIDQNGARQVTQVFGPPPV